MGESNGSSGQGFRHQALMYAGADHFVARALPIISSALEAEQPVLIAVDRAKIGLLRDQLGSAADSVAWTDIRGIGGNPARIIPLWHQFVNRHQHRGPLWGFGEPIWSGRTPAELVEAQRHEQLLNVAFARTNGFTLLCPYDTTSLHDDILREAQHSHPVITETVDRASGSYPGLAALAVAFDAPLPEPTTAAAGLVLDGIPFSGIRCFLSDHVAGGADLARMDDLAIAISAVFASAGRPGVRLRAWREADSVRAEMSALEPLDDPLAGREWPPPSQGATRGLWLANQLCDLVELRSTAVSAVVRLHLAAPVAAR